MTEHETYLVGRSRDADIVITDASVSRAHAELIVTADGRYFLNDCGSRFGTHIRQSGHWNAIRQVFVGRTDAIKFGDYETTVDDLMNRLASGRSAPESNGPDTDDAGRQRTTR